MEEIFVTEFSIENTGWKTISKTDILKEIYFQLNDVKLLDVIINSSIPKNLDILINKFNEKSFFIDFELLNRNEKIYFSILTNKNIDSFKIETRIKNISDIQIRDYIAKPDLYKLPSFYFTIIFIFFIFLCYFLIKSKSELRKNSFYFFKKFKTRL